MINRKVFPAIPAIQHPLNRCRSIPQVSFALLVLVVAAKLIIERIKEDNMQFDALLRSIGELVDSETTINSDGL